jgi:hypothetical protein
MATALIYNRDGSLGENGWVHIVPKGELPNAEAGIVQVLDDVALNSIISSFNAAKRRMGDRFPGLYFGVEHHIYDPSQSSEALGWSKELALRDNGVWALLEPTDIGSVAIRNRRFKFTSFVADPKDTTPLGENRVRVMRIESVGFTNLPNGKDMLVPIANRAAGAGAGAPSAKPSVAVQNRAAQRIGKLAEQEQRASGGSLSGCYVRVLNRETTLCELATGRPVSAGVKAVAREVLENAAFFAGRAVLRLAQSRKAPGLSANVSYIRNRFPRLARMENRGAGWDVLAELEPTARKAYMDTVQQPRDSMPEPRWSGFFGMLDALAAEFPDLGYEGAWQKMKEVYPATFLKFVLSFDDQEGPSDMLAPAPKTEQEIYREKRARINQAASSEFRRYGRNGTGAQQLAQDTVAEALRAL